MQLICKIGSIDVVFLDDSAFFYLLTTAWDSKRSLYFGIPYSKDIFPIQIFLYFLILTTSYDKSTHNLTRHDEFPLKANPDSLEAVSLSNIAISSHCVESK
mmetsp:Transcript_20037/g.36384  ORF Transcript_20037/g.36384 Transcript_20037/m.36384 type:complete len:101 (+) Transcript_20037:132-434(+)